MKSTEIKTRSPFSTETDDFNCLEAVGIPGLQGSKTHQFLHWRDSLLILGMLIIPEVFVTKRCDAFLLKGYYEIMKKLGWIRSLYNSYFI